METLYQISEFGNGTLYAMPAPWPSSLKQQIIELKHHGIEKIVSLLDQGEAADVELADEAHVCHELEIEFRNFPIRNHSIPEILEFRTFVKQLLAELDSGKQLVIHCLAGIGRSGLVASCILIESGMAADDAMSLVSHMRTVPVPETKQQIDFVKTYATA